MINTIYIKKLLQILDNYTNDQIDSITDSYFYYSKSFVKKLKSKTFLKVYNLLNEIIRTIAKNNLISIYYGDYSQSLSEYELRVEYEELEPLYDDLSESGKKLNKWMMRRSHAKVIKRDVNNFASLISTNRLIRKVLTGKSNDIIYDFNELFSFFEKMDMNNKDMINATINIIQMNINNGIYSIELDSMEINDIIRAHRIIQDEYLNKVNTNEEYDIESLMRAFSLLGYPNPYALKSFLEKINKKKSTNEKPIKLNCGSLKVEQTPMIAKSDYYQGMQMISKYYDLDNGILKKTLKISEIQYVVTIMQNLNFSSTTIENFITKALKKHKKLSAIDRYLDLSEKIEYYKSNLDIENLDRTIHELVDEYVNSSSNDKDFWLSSINEELEALENLLNRSHNYELGIKKSQE